jgi:hypothetical protein
VQLLVRKWMGLVVGKIRREDILYGGVQYAARALVPERS